MQSLRPAEPDPGNAGVGRIPSNRPNPSPAEGFFLNHKRAIVFANGEIKFPERLRPLLPEQNYLIAVDGGLKHLQSIGLSPDILIGDLDSVSADDVKTVKDKGGVIMQYPVEKDETDLELAINFVLDQGCDEVIIAAALGGRLDQTLGNLFLLTRPDLKEISVRLDDGQEEVFLIHSAANIFGKTGDIVSLLPLNGAVYDVKTESLKYPLNYEKLNPYETRGISNVMLSNHARVSLSRGTLVCIHTRL